MTSRQVLAVVTALALACWCGAAARASTAATPYCKVGQTSTKAKPCRKNITTNQIPDPGNIRPRRNDSDSVTVFRFLDPSAGKYQIEVDNTSGIGYINSFNWVPPTSLTITAITSTEGGHCTLVANTVPGEGTPMISCIGGQKGIAPPKCTCLQGGALLVNFLATNSSPPTFNGKYWTYYGIVGAYTKITSMTPVPYHIPSVLPSQTEDLPVCKKGETSTAKNPCTTSG